MAWTDICAFEDLVENSGICALLNGRQVAVFLLELQGEDLRHARGSLIGYVAQDPATALNPALRIGALLRETLAAHRVLVLTQHPLTPTDDEIETLSLLDPLTGRVRQKIPRFVVYPKSHYVTPRERVLAAMGAGATPAAAAPEDEGLNRAMPPEEQPDGWFPTALRQGQANQGADQSRAHLSAAVGRPAGDP